MLHVARRRSPPDRARRIKMGFVPNMRVPCTFFVNQHLQQLMFEELEQFVSRGDVGGFLPAVKQLANVAALPGARRCLLPPRWCLRGHRRRQF